MREPNLGLTRIWERLDERYGCPEMIEECVNQKLKSFPNLTNKDNEKLYELSDIVSEIESLKEDPKYTSLLAYYDSSSGVTQIVKKLPYNLREKWVTQAANYKKHHVVPFPPFTFFASFLREISKVKNDPILFYEIDIITPRNQNRIIVRKTEIENEQVNAIDQKCCPIHKTNHSLNDCRAFSLKTYEERKKLLIEHATVLDVVTLLNTRVEIAKQ